MSASAVKSTRLPAGLPILSQYMALVLSSIWFSIAFRSLCGANLVVIPKLGNV